MDNSYRIATAKQFNTMIYRQISVIIPEQRLLIAVLQLAVTDAYSKKRSLALPARRFLRENNVAYQLLGLNYAFMLEQLHKHAPWLNHD